MLQPELLRLKYGDGPLGALRMRSTSRIVPSPSSVFQKQCTCLADNVSLTLTRAPEGSSGAYPLQVLPS